MQSTRGTRVLVTGGAGFIGSHLVDRLIDRGDDVRVLDDFSTGRWTNLAPVAGDIEIVEGDIRDAVTVARAMRGCDAVLHQAALPSVPRSIQDPAASHGVNATGSLNVLIAARDLGVRRVVCASSSSVYGANPALPKREDMPAIPISPYAVSKLAAESYCRSFHQVYGLQAVALRYFNVFGPRQDPGSPYAAVIPKFVTALRAGKAPRIFGDGEQSRDFTYVENVVNANLAALEAPGVGGEVFNVACGEATSLNALAAALGELLDSTVLPEHGPDRPGDVRHSLAAIDKAREQLGYAPSVTLAQGLRRTLLDIAPTAEPSIAGVGVPATSTS